ncbi:MAG: LysR family transcriptional regulator [Rubrivivax sp.]|nr:LysR family transcriptional regulator [Rubrivivax sp.]MDP3221657.1 LysR family transcriptional regulator [Rubrivivax sp.]MDP3615802.1 LysR family transcriptional regulator [Rubrivivax sp.]
MDKLRALHYFVAAVEEGSFSAAARRFDVSVPAVTKLVSSLERELGVKLLDRSTQGLTLTARGAQYLESCTPLLAQLADAERALTAPGTRRARTLVVGAPPLLSRALLVPALSEWHERHPHVHIDLRTVDFLTVTDTATRGVDVLVALGWPGSVDLVQRPLAQSRLIVCASPAYWRLHGIPVRPTELANHACLLVRSPEGTVLDLWRHMRDGVVEEVAVTGWLTCASRDDVLQAVLLGQGVGRFADLSVWPFVRDGLLQPVLVDWESSDSPPFSALIRPESKRDAVVQGFVGFLTDLLAPIETKCGEAFGARPSAVRPRWYASRPGRASKSRGE